MTGWRAVVGHLAGLDVPGQGEGAGGRALGQAVPLHHHAVWDVVLSVASVTQYYTWGH